MAIKNSVSNYFWYMLVNSILTLSIAAYAVLFSCILHDATVDILFGTACA